MDPREQRRQREKKYAEGGTGVGQKGQPIQQQRTQQDQWAANARNTKTSTTRTVSNNRNAQITAMPRETTGPKTTGVPKSTNMPSQQDNWRRHGQNTTTSTTKVQKKNNIQMTSHNRGDGGKVDTNQRNSSRQVLEKGFQDEAQRRAEEARRNAANRRGR